MSNIELTRIATCVAGSPVVISYEVTKDGKDVSSDMLDETSRGGFAPSYRLSRVLTDTCSEGNPRGIFGHHLSIPETVTFYRGQDGDTSREGFAEVVFNEVLDETLSNSDYFRIVNDRIQLVKQAFLAKYPDTKVDRVSTSWTVADKK